MKIAVATIHTPEIKSYALVTEANKAAYCDLHSYDFISPEKRLSDRPPSWDKVRLLLDNLPNYDWIFWLDADAFITNLSISFEQFPLHQADVIIAADHNGLNCGSFLMRNCEWSMRFLNEVWEQEDLIHHCWWEQAGFHRLYQQNREHFGIVSLRSLNSMEHVWQPGDFVLHLAGTSNGHREARFKALSKALERHAEPWLLTLNGRGDLAGLLNRSGLVGNAAYAGAFDAGFASSFLEHWAGARFYCVGPGCAELAERVGGNSRPKLDANKTTVDEIDDGSLDFVYVSIGESNFPGGSEIDKWHAKLRDGGILSTNINLLEHSLGANPSDVWQTLEHDKPTYSLLKEIGKGGRSRALDELLRRQVVGRKYLYRRITYDRRVMEFRQDGTIGYGIAGAEQRWRINDQQLLLEGQFGVICALIRDAKGVFRGRWSQFEKMKIELWPLDDLLSFDPGLARDPMLHENVDWGEGCALDIGAGHGEWTHSLAKRYRKVIAFEPQPQRAEALRLQGLLNVDVRNVAAWSCRGSIDLEVGAVDSSSTIWQTIQVAVTDIDAVIKDEAIDLIKIEISGSAPSAVLGLSKTIHKYRPRVLISCRTSEDGEWLRCFLGRNGYDVTFLYAPAQIEAGKEPKQSFWIAAKYRRFQ